MIADVDPMPQSVLQHMSQRILAVKHPAIIRVHLSRVNIHRIYASEALHACKVRKAFPLETRLSEGMDMEKVIDCRAMTEEWHVALSGS